MGAESQPEYYRSRLAEVARLVSLPGGAPREFRLLGDSALIGSAADADFVIDDVTVSRRHALIKKQRGRFVISDLDSSNGTFINGRRIEQDAFLTRGDDLRLGAVHFTFFEPETPPQQLRRQLRVRLALQGLIAAVLLLAAIGYLLGRHYYGVDFFSGAKPPPTPPYGMSWVARLNYYRLLSRLQPIEEDPSISVGDVNHARYLVANQAAMIRSGNIDASIHSEVPGKPFFTPEGKAAGELSDVDAVFTDPPEDPEPAWAIENWITGPFHRLWLLNPQLRRVGYGQFCEKGICAAALDMRSGIEDSASDQVKSQLVMFPSNGATIHNGTFAADEAEWPDPLSACPGYATPTGRPITLQLGLDRPALLEDFSLTRNGAAAKVCGFDSASYRSADRIARERARKELAHFGAVVLVPREPLARGATYTVSIKASGKVYSWWFAVVP